VRHPSSYGKILNMNTGLGCPECGSCESGVVDSRGTTDGIRRRRLCEYCGYRFSTVEVLATRTAFGRHGMLVNIREAAIEREVCKRVEAILADALRKLRGQNEIPDDSVA